MNSLEHCSKRESFEDEEVREGRGRNYTTNDLLHILLRSMRDVHRDSATIIRASIMVHWVMANVSIATNPKGSFFDTGQTTGNGLLRTCILPLGATINTSDTTATNLGVSNCSVETNDEGRTGSTRLKLGGTG
jgi:hypothetical protein